MIFIILMFKNKYNFFALSCLKKLLGGDSGFWHLGI